MIWFGVAVLVVGYFIYRLDRKFKVKFDDKFNPNEWDVAPLLEPQKADSAQPVYEYEKKESLLSNAEKLLFDSLMVALADEYVLLAKISVADVLTIKSVSDPSSVAAQTGKQFPFVVCDKTQLRVLCVIVLQEKTYSSSESSLVLTCHAAQLPLLRLERQLKYDTQQLRQKIRATIDALPINKLPYNNTNSERENHSERENSREHENKREHENNNEQDTNSVFEISNVVEIKPANAHIEALDAPRKVVECPKCAAAMVKRRTKTAELWVCRHYPECRGVVASDAR